MPLTVLVTRPQAQAEDWVARLRVKGIDARALPLLAIEPATDTLAMHAAWRAIDTVDLAMFVSPNAVQGFFDARPDGATWPTILRAAATGPGSVQALVDAGVARERCVAPAHAPFDSAALWAMLRHEPWPGRRALVVRGDGGRDEFAQALRDAGAQVSFVQAYLRQPPRWRDAERALAAEALARPQAHVWLLSSAEGASHLALLLPGAAWHGSTAIASHARIAETARRAGFGRVVAASPTLESVVSALGQLEAAS
jgi:uroporphyrinogen-III synthase